MADTIFALSSGAPPSGIGVVRISGAGAAATLEALAGPLPEPRVATLRPIADSTGLMLDRGLILWFPAPASATGEDVAELHVHGGRAVVASVLAALSKRPGLRPAQPGEFTRRAFENGRIDLAEAEGLADLLAAETEWQRRCALALAEGGLGREAARWRDAVLRISAQVEAELDFADEADIEREGISWRENAQALAIEWDKALAQPSAERLRDGIRVVLAGPPNAGKSSLFNVLVGRDAAIVTDIAGTTRDRIEAPVAIDGVPLVLIDTAGLHDAAADAVEAIGMARTGEALESADVILWLGDADTMPRDALLIAAKADLGRGGPGLPVSAQTGEGVEALKAAILERARTLLPMPDAIALNARHRVLIGEARDALRNAAEEPDMLIAAEHLRQARAAIDGLTGSTGIEAMLDALFGQFCVGK